MKEIDLVTLGRGLAPVIQKAIAQEMAGVRARLSALEGDPPETWQATRGYSAGAAVADSNGTIWIAKRDCSGEKPGTGDAWRLA